MKNAIKIAALALAVTFSFAAFSNDAKAATLTDCKPSYVTLDFFGAPSSPRLAIWCTADSRWYYTNPNSSCTSRPLENVKAWEVLATSALLSGKRLNINYTVCGAASDRSIDQLALTL